jgi:acyl-CoA thioester hydrolase
MVRREIRWRDMDALGHVNNAVYITYIEELLIHSLGPVLGDSFVTAQLDLSFRRELRYDDREVVARGSLMRVGTSSLTLGLSLGRMDGEVAVEGRIVVVAWDPRQRKSRPLTTGEKEQLHRLFET